MAWEYLSQKGHRRIICLHHERSGQAVADRMDAFAAARSETDGEAQALPLRFGTDPIGQIGPGDEERILRTLRETGSTAIFAADGASSVIAYEVLARHGVAIPNECSLIGIDVPVWSGVAQVVTQLACPGRQVGQEAARLLAARLDGIPRTPRQVLVPPVLQERTSVAAR